MNWQELRTYSYVPYSGDPRVCVVESSSDELHPGVRIENVSYPLTITAIQAALFNCISSGQTPQSIYIDNAPDAQLAFWEKEYDLEVRDKSDLPSLPWHDPQLEIADQTESLKQLATSAVPLHSDFPVSALLTLDDGTCLGGVNIECSDWSMGLCAERVVLSKAFSYGYQSFDNLHIYAPKGEFSSPCGACRQVIVEHMQHHKIHLLHSNGSSSYHFSSHLMPFSFMSTSLQRNK